eukprot:10955771-Prorocentrum_lima.AAC.1
MVVLGPRRVNRLLRKCRLWHSSRGWLAGVRVHLHLRALLAQPPCKLSVFGWCCRWGSTGI